MDIKAQITMELRGNTLLSEEESKQIDEGLNLFREWFMALWW